MVQFGFARVRGRLMVYEVTLERWGDGMVYVATRSDEPRVRFSGPTAAVAVERLVRHVRALRPRTVLPLCDPSGRRVFDWVRVLPHCRDDA